MHYRADKKPSLKTFRESLFDNEFNLIKNIDSILAPFLKYLEPLLCLINDLNSDDVDGVGCRRGRKKYIKGL